MVLYSSVYGGAQVEFVELFKDAALPIVKVFILCFLGAVAAHANIFEPGARKHVSVLVFNVFAPSLMTMKLASAVDMQNIRSWWSLPANICLSIVIGWVLGWICAKLTRAPADITSMLSAVTALGNVGNLPLVLVETLGRGNSPFGQDVSDLGVAYVAFGIWVASIFQFSISYYLLAPKDTSQPTSYTPLPAENGDSAARVLPGHDTSAGLTPLVVEHTCTGSSLDDDARPPSPYTASYQGSPMAPLLNSYEDPETVRGFQQSHNSRLINMGSEMHISGMLEKEGCCWSFCNCTVSVWNGIKRTFFKVKWGNIFTFPIKCCFAAIAVGLIKPAKDLLVGPAAPLAIVKESLETMGGAMIPCMMMVLGANLSKGPPPCSLPSISIFAVAAVRLLIAPIVGVSIVIVSVHLGIVVPPDSFFMFVLMLQHCMPTAINMHTVATLHQNGVAEVTNVLFWQYLASIVTVPCWMMFFLYYLRTYSPFAIDMGNE